MPPAKAFKTYLNPMAHRLSHSVHVNELFVFFVFTEDHRLDGSDLRLIHDTVLSIVITPTEVVLEVRGLVDVDLAKFIYEESLLRCE